MFGPCIYITNFLSCDRCWIMEAQKQKEKRAENKDGTDHMQLHVLPGDQLIRAGRNTDIETRDGISSYGL